MISALESLQRLRDGNARFASNVRGLESFLSQERRARLADGQAPHAVVLGCSDSRVPVEIVFDQGLGDLFVIRVAGNIVAPSLVGSVEYAAEFFGTRLVVVLGHSRCGAVNATIDELQRPTVPERLDLDVTALTPDAAAAAIERHVSGLRASLVPATERHLSMR